MLLRGEQYGGFVGRGQPCPGIRGFQSAHRPGTAIQAGDRQVKNVPDPTRVGRVDARNDQQGADNALASDVLRYDSNLQAFLQSLREAPELPAVLRRTMTLLRSTVQTPGAPGGHCPRNLPDYCRCSGWTRRVFPAFL